MLKRENWLFGFAAIGAVAALMRILEFCGINPSKTLNAPPVGGGAPMPVTHGYAALIWGIGFFAFSIGLSLYGFYDVNRKRNAPHKNDVLETAPRPLITYDGAGEKIMERWADIVPVYNDGPTEATGISFGPLTWVDRRFFGTAREVKSIPSKNHGRACLTFDSGSPGHERLAQFVQFLESQHLKPTVTVTFQDPNGNHFCCDYTLHYKTGGTVRWNPGPIRRPELKDGKLD